jgi:hypothetical protein
MKLTDFNVLTSCPKPHCAWGISIYLYTEYITSMYIDLRCIYQVYELNKKISAVSKDRNSLLFNVPPVVDPSNEIAEVHVEALEWNMLNREWNMSVSDLQEFHNERNSSADFLSFHAFWTEMQPQLFHTSTAADRRTISECCCADGSGPNSWRGSHFYEINTWLWNFGRPQPEKILGNSRFEAAKRVWATKLSRSDICMVYT